jgi:hypothetical protein
VQTPASRGHGDERLQSRGIDAVGDAAGAEQKTRVARARSFSRRRSATSRSLAPTVAAALRTEPLSPGFCSY